MADKKTLQNPFPGLRPFQSDEEHLFFGRETQTLELLQILRDNRFVGVIGTSGSGKSSLVRCGLLSELYGGSFLKAGTDWEVAVMNPGGGPFNQLSKSLVASDIYDSEEADVHLKLNATLRRSRLGLVEAIRQAKLPEGTNFLLVVDQFEEIFRYSEAGEEEGEAADDFISMILEAAKQSNIPIYVIITMRSDYIGDCSKFEGLPEEINEGEYLIPRLSREEYKSVIEGPIRVGGGKLAPRLLQRLLNDIGTESDQLPCLQHALMRTWDAWADRDGSEELDLEDYRAIGGMGKALSIHADEIFDTFSDEGTRETATRMFRAITEKGDDNRGIRRPLRLQQLVDITNHSIEEVKSVVDPYRQQGVTFLMPPSNRELEPETVIDISHESLMRVWQRLRNWVEEEAQSARIYRRLVDTSSLWKKEEAGLYHDPDLQIAQSWRDEYEPNEAWADLYGGGFEIATEFLEASEGEGRKAEREKELARQKELEQAQELAEARERSAKNMKRFAAVVGVVAIIALGAMIFAVKAQKKAVVAQKSAIEAKGLAETAKETLRKEFINSDINLGISFSNQNQIGRGLAHFARALERDPNNAAIIDKSFNLLAYSHPPGYNAPNPNFESNFIQTSTGSWDGTNVITAIHQDNEHINQTPNLMVWEPNSRIPKHSIYVGPGRFQWGNDIDVSPDGKTAALGLHGVHLLDIESGSIKKLYDSRRARCVIYSSDGTKILTASGNNGGAAHILDAQTGEPIGSYETKTFQPKWSPDETKLFFGAHRNGKSAIYDLLKDEVKDFVHEGIPRMTPFGGFDRTSSRILSITQDQRFNVWNIESGELEYYVTHNRLDSGFVGAVGVFTPDNQKLITVARDLFVRLWDANDGTPIDAVNIPSNHAFGQEPVFSEDGQRIMIPLQNGQAFTGTFDEDYSNLPDFSQTVSINEAHAFLANDGKLKPLLLPVANISSGSVGSEGKGIILATSEGTAGIYNLQTGESLSEKIAHSGLINAITQSPDGSKIATSSNLGTVNIWDRSNLKSPIRVIGSENTSNRVDLQKVHFTSDGKAVWVSNPKESKKWDISTGEILIDSQTYPTKSLSITSVDGSYTAITRWPRLKLYNNNSTSNDPVFLKHAGGRIDAICFSKDNKYIVAGTANGHIRVWSTSDGTAKKSFTLSFGSLTENIDSIAVNDKFTQIAAGCKSGQLYLLDLNDKDDKERVIPKGEIFRSELINKESENHSVEIDVNIEGAKKLYLVVEDGGDQWQHDVANWIEPKIIVNNEEKWLTSLEWINATTSWGSVKINQNVAGQNLDVGGKSYSNGIGTHSVSVIEYKLPEGATRFSSIAGIDDKALNFNNGNPLSSVRFAVHKDFEPNFDETFISFKGNAPCSDLQFSTSGEILAATFTDNELSYLQAWDVQSLQPLTEKLSNGSAISKLAYLNNDSQIIAWADQRNGGTNGRASVWDISIRGNLKSSNDYAEIIKGLGKEELDENSKAVRTGNISNNLGLISDLDDDSLFNKFLKWQQLFPSKRGDSPFRPSPSDNYINALISQDDFHQLTEAVRLSPTNAVAIVKRGATRLTLSEYPTDSDKIRSYSDAIKSVLLEPSNLQVSLLAGSIHAYLGNTSLAKLLLIQSQSLDKLELEELLSIIGIQEKLNLDESLRRFLLNQAIAITTESDETLNRKLIISRFKLATNAENYDGALSDWNIIKEWENSLSDTSFHDLLSLYFSAVENRAGTLVTDGRFEEAINLIKPAAIASLTLPDNQLHSLVTKLMAWENRDSPPFTLIEKNSTWEYLDDGTDPGAEWFQPWAPADGWSKGKAKLGYGGDGEVTTLDYGNDLNNKHISYYFRKTFEINDQTLPSILTANIIRDDGIIVYLNGKEIIRNQMPGGAVNYLTPASQVADSSGEGEITLLTFSIDGDLLEKGENVISAEIHQVNGKSSDIGFQLELLGSNQDITGYLTDLLKGETGTELLINAIQIMPQRFRENSKKSFQFLLGEFSESNLKDASIEVASTAINIGKKLKVNKETIDAIDYKVRLLENEPTSRNLTERVIVLNHKKSLLKRNGSTVQELELLEKEICSPPRNPNLSEKSINLETHFNASIFHYSKWHANDENFDMRFLPESYNGATPFDLRGLIQLNSGPFNNGDTANEFGWVKGLNKHYPNSVEKIKIKSKAERIHFLVGGLFAHEMQKGASAMIITINYEDETTSVLDLKSNEDIFNWWSTDWADSIPEENLGFLGPNNLGNERFLTKPIWTNPNPEKVISHIDLTSGLIKCAPFVVGITIE